MVEGKYIRERQLIEKEEVQITIVKIWNLAQAVWLSG